MAEKRSTQFYPVQEGFIPTIKIIGVGGAGGNVVTQMAEENFDQVETIICNTDVKALKRNKSHKKIELGKKLTLGPLKASLAFPPPPATRRRRMICKITSSAESSMPNLLSEIVRLSTPTR